jgi:STE24 endopeptidase
LGAVPQALPAGARIVVSRRNLGGAPLTALRRVLVALAVALVVLAGAQRADAARTRLDARVDALTSHQLLTRSAAVLVDPGRQRRARAIADLSHGASAGWALAQILAFWWLWRSGGAARLRDTMRRRTRSRPLQRAVFGAAMGALAPVAAFPFALLSYRVGFNAGVTDERLRAWVVDYLMRVALDAAIGALVVVSVLALVDRFRGRWYIVLGLLLYAGSLAAVAFLPLLPIGTPHKPTPHADAALGADVARSVGVPGTPLVVIASSRHSNAMTTNAAGIGSTARVVVGDVTLVHLEPAELRYVLAVAFARVREGVTLRQTLLATTLLIVSAAIAIVLSDRIGFRRDDDALSRLSLVATFLGLVLVVTYPVYNLYGRKLARGADAIALTATGDRPAAARALVRNADDDMVLLCDRRSLRWYFDDRPPLGSRIAAIAGTTDPCRAPDNTRSAAPSP